MISIAKLQTGIAATVLLALASLSINAVTRRTNSIPTSWQVGTLDERLSFPDPTNAQLSRQLTDNPKGSWRQRVAERREELRLIHDQEVAAESDAVSDSDSDLEPLTICDRPIGTTVGTAQGFPMQRTQAECPALTHKKMIVVQGRSAYGRTGNNLVEFLHSLQYAHDNDVTVGIMINSWAIKMLVKMWMAIPQGDNSINGGDGEWIRNFEEAFCVKIFGSSDQIVEEGWDAVPMSSVKLFRYRTKATEEEYMKYMGEQLRSMWSHYNTGVGVDHGGKPVNDMCSGIDAIFGDDNNEQQSRGDAVYTTIHARSLEGHAGIGLLGEVARNSGCDPVAALHMEPEYVKAILEPLGMIDHPIVLITDGEDNAIVDRLRNDPVIGPKLHLVPEEASWIGGDITVALMGNVFIGNPASTFSRFIARSRLAMGFGNNFLFRAKNEVGEWVSVCGDECIYNRKVLSSKKLSY